MKYNRINYVRCLIRLALIILISEFLIMILFSFFDIEKNLSSVSSALLDGTCLLLLSSYPVYVWIFRPLVEFFLHRQRELEMLSEALQGAGDSVLITNPDGDIIYVNSSFSHVTGYSRDEVIGKNPNILSSGKQSRQFYETMWKSIREQGAWKGELWNKRKNGELYPESLDIRAIHYESGEIKFFVGIFSDLTEKKAIEHALLQSQKLEAVGTLVGGVAHNFNNLLAAITGKAYLAEHSKSPEKTKRLNRDIQNLSHESAQLIRQLLTFARETEHEKQHFPIVPLLQEAIKTASIGIPETVTLTTDIASGNWTVYGDAVNIKQSIINIINNARDAVATTQQKNITINMRMVERKACSHAQQCETLCSHAVQIEIIDSGEGINTADIDRIFEPFFTTKSPDLGTGLGLSTALGTIQDHGGSLIVESQFSKGTKFLICLPADQHAIPEHADAGKVMNSSMDKTILVVDDDEHVRSTTAQILRSLGYKAICAVNGQDALEQFSGHEGRIDLLITDMVMPVMDGAELAFKLREHNKQLPVILMTGYDPSKSDELLSSQGMVVISKPFETAALSQRVFEQLQ